MISDSNVDGIVIIVIINIFKWDFSGREYQQSKGIYPYLYPFHQHAYPYQYRIHQSLNSQNVILGYLYYLQNSD